MSDMTNDRLYERAENCMAYFENELPARLIERDLDTFDLEALAFHVKEAEAMMAMQEQSDV